MWLADTCQQADLWRLSTKSRVLPLGGDSILSPESANFKLSLDFLFVDCKWSGQNCAKIPLQREEGRMRGRRVGESKREENREKGSVEKRTPPVEGGLGGAEKGVGQDCGSKEVKLATEGA